MRIHHADVVVPRNVRTRDALEQSICGCSLVHEHSGEHRLVFGFIRLVVASRQHIAAQRIPTVVPQGFRPLLHGRNMFLRGLAAIAEAGDDGQRECPLIRQSGVEAPFRIEHGHLDVLVRVAVRQRGIGMVDVEHQQPGKARRTLVYGCGDGAACDPESAVGRELKYAAGDFVRIKQLVVGAQFGVLQAVGLEAHPQRGPE